MSAYHSRRPYLLLLYRSGKSGQLCARAFPLKTWEVSLSIGVRITMIRCVVYLLAIFKMFHGLMNNPVHILPKLKHTLQTPPNTRTHTHQRITKQFKTTTFQVKTTTVQVTTTTYQDIPK
jgi:hypothetical protein